MPIPILVRDVMTPDPMAVPPSLPLGVAAAQMRERGIRHLPVVLDGALIGVVSNKDLARGGATVGEAMTANPMTVRTEDRVEVAAAAMALHKVSCLPVLEDVRLVGIVTTYDLLDALARRLRDR
ncbi:MAG: CBS domain-containing protein [Myxococcota bacterium]